MEKTPAPPVLLEPGAYERTFREDGQALLTVRARWPRLRQDSPGARRVDRYYDSLAQRWLRRWEGPLLARARAEKPPEEPAWRATLAFTVTLVQEGLLSLYWDAAEDTGARRPRRARMGDVWRLPQGVPVTLRELLPQRRWWRGPVYEEIRRQVGRQVEAGEAIFYEDWPALVSRRFSPERFYLTQDGPVVFYPVESIAPALEGFPTFSLGAVAARTEPAEGQ